MSQANEKPELLVSYYYPYIWVFWKQAEPAPCEVEAVHSVDPGFRGTSLAQVAERLSPTFALSAKSKIFLARFPRCSLASADWESKSGVVETYPLEPAMANLR